MSEREAKELALLDAQTRAADELAALYKTAREIVEVAKGPVAGFVAQIVKDIDEERRHARR